MPINISRTKTTHKQIHFIFKFCTIVVLCIIAEKLIIIKKSFSTCTLLLRGCTGLQLILYSIDSTATDRQWAMSHSNTPPVRNRAQLTARSSSLRCVSAAEHHTEEQCSKTPRYRTSLYSSTFILLSVSLWNDFANPVLYGAGLVGFKSRANAFLLA